VCFWGLKNSNPVIDKGPNYLITKSITGLLKKSSKRYSPKNPIENLYRKILVIDREWRGRAGAFKCPGF
jgi:hypothetical protein